MVRYLEEFLDYEWRLDRGDAAGRDEEDMCMSFAPAFFRCKVLHHVVSRQVEVLPIRESIRSVAVVVLHTGEERRLCAEIPGHSGPGKPWLF